MRGLPVLRSSILWQDLAIYFKICFPLNSGCAQLGLDAFEGGDRDEGFCGSGPQAGQNGAWAADVPVFVLESMFKSIE